MTKEDADQIRIWKAALVLMDGRTDNGRPLGAEAARQIAREALTQHDRGW